MKLRKGRVALVISAVAALLLVLPGAVGMAGNPPPEGENLNGPAVTGYFIFKPNTDDPLRAGVVFSMVGECQGKLVSVFEYDMGEAPKYTQVTEGGLQDFYFTDPYVLPADCRAKDALAIVVKGVQGFVEYPASQDHGPYKAAKLFLLFSVPQGK